MTIEEKDGVIIVRNPKKPVSVSGEPHALSLEEDLRIGVLEGEDPYMFGFLRSVQVDDEENIYILDAEFIEVRVYDRNGRHLRSFGREGQGPGEFAWPSRMYLRPDNQDLAITDSNNDRLCYYSLEGECLKELRVAKHGTLIRAWPDSRGRIYGDVLDFAPGFSVSNLNKYDIEMENKLATLVELKKKQVPGERSPILYRILFSVREDDTVTWAINQEYCIHILNPSGELMKKIYKDYDAVIFSKAEKKRIEDEEASEGIASSLKLVFPEAYPPMYYMISDDQGRIYIMTHFKNEAGLCQWDVFDEEGRYILNFFHPEEDLIFCIKNDEAYSMNQYNEEGNPHIRRYRMTWELR